jgi:hypothetical protein
MNRLVFRPSLSVIFFFRIGIALSIRSQRPGAIRPALHPLVRLIHESRFFTLP